MKLLECLFKTGDCLGLLKAGSTVHYHTCHAQAHDISMRNCTGCVCMCACTCVHLHIDRLVWLMCVPFTPYVFTHARTHLIFMWTHAHVLTHARTHTHACANRNLSMHTYIPRTHACVHTYQSFGTYMLMQVTAAHHHNEPTETMRICLQGADETKTAECSQSMRCQQLTLYK